MRLLYYSSAHKFLTTRVPALASRPISLAMARKPYAYSIPVQENRVIIVVMCINTKLSMDRVWGNRP
jgi:hypothetical protein